MAMTGLMDLSAAQTEGEGGDHSNLLAVILDINPAWWAERALPRQRTASNGHTSSSSSSSSTDSIVTVMDHIMVFLNTYLLLQSTNQLLVIGCLSSKSHSLYPPETTPTSQPVTDSRPDLFRNVNHSILSEVRRLLLKAVEDGESGTDESRETVFVGALSRALCYIQRIQREAPKGHTIRGRILVIESGQDSPLHYMHFINTAFTAQKMNVRIDACILGEHSTLLQQAVDLTDGVYIKVEQLSGLVQILNSVFLLDSSERTKFVVPEKVLVDYRAACFCHQKLIEVGFVCSVCLSVFCTFSPVCSTCQTTFKFMTGVKKRKTEGTTVPSPSKSQPKPGSRSNGTAVNGR